MMISNLSRDTAPTSSRYKHRQKEMTTSFTEEQKSFIKAHGISYDFDSETDESRCMLEDAIGDIYMWASMDYDERQDESILATMRMCESILDPAG